MMRGETTRSRGHKKRARTRAQLLRAAADVLAREGEGFSVSDVVAAADVANGTFYNYFHDREALLDALAADLAMALAAAVAAETPARDGAVRVATATARVIARAAADPAWGRLMLRLEAMRSAVRAEVGRHLRADLRLGIRQRRFDAIPVAVAVDLVGGVLLTAVRRTVEGAAPRGYATALVTRLLRALGTPAQAAAKIAATACAAA